MALDIANFRTRTALDEFSIKYANDQKDFIAEDLFPTVMVDKDQFKIYQHDTSHFRVIETRRASNAEADKVDWNVFTTNGQTVPHKAAAEIDPRDEALADAAVADMEMDAAEAVMSTLLITRERAAATLATTSSNYPADLTSALTDSSTRWVDSGGDPESDSKTARDAVWARCRKEANALAISRNGLGALMNSPALKDRIKYTNSQSITIEMIKNLLMVDYIFVGKAGAMTSLEGNATQTISDIWSDNAIFFVYDAAAKRRTVCYGRTYMLDQLYTYTYEEQRKGSAKGRIKVIEKGWEYTQQAGAVVSSSDTDFTAGYLLRNVY